MDKDAALNWVLSQLSIHMDGDDNQAHLSATKQNAGFMTPQLVQFATGERWKDNYLSETYPATTDLPVGKYATVANFTDNPPNVSSGDICQIDVFMENPTRKQILFTHGYTGRVYLKMVYGNNDRVPNDWGAIERYVTLWEGSVKATGAEFKLSDSFVKFKKLEITYNCAGTHIDIVPSVGYNEKCQVKQINLYDSADSTTYQVCECQLTNIGDGKFRITLNKSITNSGTSQNVGTDPITITKVVGVC